MPELIDRSEGRLAAYGISTVRAVPESGCRVIGLGTNRFGTDQLPQEEVSKIIDAALDLGINFIDTANTYVRGRCEETLGHALKGRRERFILATKGVLPIGDGPNDRGASRYHLLQAFEISLRRLHDGSHRPVLRASLG